MTDAGVKTLAAVKTKSQFEPGRNSTGTALDREKEAESESKEKENVSCWSSITTDYVLEEWKRHDPDDLKDVIRDSYNNIAFVAALIMMAICTLLVVPFPGGCLTYYIKPEDPPPPPASPPAPPPSLPLECKFETERVVFGYSVAFGMMLTFLAVLASVRTNLAIVSMNADAVKLSIKDHPAIFKYPFVILNLSAAATIVAVGTFLRVVFDEVVVAICVVILGVFTIRFVQLHQYLADLVVNEELPKAREEVQAFANKLESHFKDFAPLSGEPGSPAGLADFDSQRSGMWGGASRTGGRDSVMEPTTPGGKGRQNVKNMKAALKEHHDDKKIQIDSARKMRRASSRVSSKGSLFGPASPMAGGSPSAQSPGRARPQKFSSMSSLGGISKSPSVMVVAEVDEEGEMSVTAPVAGGGVAAAAAAAEAAEAARANSDVVVTVAEAEAVALTTTATKQHGEAPEGMTKIAKEAAAGGLDTPPPSPSPREDWHDAEEVVVPDGDEHITRTTGTASAGEGIGGTATTSPLSTPTPTPALSRATLEKGKGGRHSVA